MRSLLAGSIACLLLATTAKAAQAATIADFMVMTVCASPDDRPLAGVIPGDTACIRPRKIRAGELPPYQLNNFAVIGSPCPARLGIISRDNVPFVMAGVSRIVSYDWHTERSGCAARAAPSLEAASVQWFDEKFGYILGDITANGAYSFDSRPLCSQDSTDASRFARGWVIGPATLPPLRQPGYIMLEGTISRGQPTSLFGRCPSGGQRYLTTWVMDSVAYTSGKALVSLISDHYSLSDPAGVSPGTAQQMERTYWTQAFGLTRWEKWARADWIGGADTSAALSRQLMSEHACSTPPTLPPRIAPGLEMGPVAADATFSQIARDPRNGAQNVWYMVRCLDYTNLTRVPPAGPLALPDGYAGWWTNRPPS